MNTDVFEMVLSLAFPVAVSGFLIFAVICAIVGKKRRDAVAKFAAEHGLEFEPDGDRELLSRLSGSDLMRTKLRKRISNLFVAEAGGVKFRIFDFHGNNGKRAVKTKSGWTKRERVGRNTSQTVLLIESVQFSCPRIRMNSDSQDQIQSKDAFELDLHGVINRHENLSVETFEKRILVYKNRHLQPAEQLKDFMAIGYEILTLANKYHATQTSSTNAGVGV